MRFLPFLIIAGLVVLFVVIRKKKTAAALGAATPPAGPVTITLPAPNASDKAGNIKAAQTLVAQGQGGSMQWWAYNAANGGISQRMLQALQQVSAETGHQTIALFSPDWAHAQNIAAGRVAS